MMLTFENYSFSMLTLRLTCHNVDIELRPKTAELLRELIASRDVVISKRQLILKVWKTEHVSDQSLFQAISELRSKLGPLSAIKTFPNRGYQWIVPVTEQVTEQVTKSFTNRVIKQNSIRPIAMAVVLTWCAFSVVTLLAGVFFVTSKKENQAVQPHTLSALDTFSLGAAALQNGDAGRATELLQMSVIERPDFSEARLLLAEASLIAGNPVSARHQAQALVESSKPLKSAYTLIGAMDLLSRSEQALGQNYSALNWAVQAATHAGDEGFECTAADLQDRLWVLLDTARQAPFASLTSPVSEPPLMQQILQAARVSVPDSSEVYAWAQLDELLDNRVQAQRPAHCARPSVSPPASQLLSVQPQRMVFQLDSYKSLI